MASTSSFIGHLQSSATQAGRRSTGGHCDYAILCWRKKLRTVSLGCAPTPSQCLTRSTSSLISAGFLSGSYVPTASTIRPFRGLLLSITTTRENGLFFLPNLDRRILSTPSD